MTIKQIVNEEWANAYGKKEGYPTADDLWPCVLARWRTLREENPSQRYPSPKTVKRYVRELQVKHYLANFS